MSDSNHQLVESFLESIPEKYDRCLGQLFFRPCALNLLEGVSGGPRILDLACGTGISTEELVRKFPQATIVGIDPSRSMLEFARRKPHLTRAKFREVCAEDLEMTSDFELIVCQFGFMFFDDPSVALKNCHRALAAGGQMVASTWCDLSENPLSLLVQQVIGSRLDERSRQLLEKPFSLGQPKSLTSTFLECGFSEVNIQHLEVSIQETSAAVAVEGLTEGNPVVKKLIEPGFENLEATKQDLLREIIAQFGDPVRTTLSYWSISASKL